MNGIEVGDIILVTGLIEVEYIKKEQVYRYIVRSRINSKRAWYVGYTHKQYGKIDPGFNRSFSAIGEPPEYEPPQLIIEGTFLVYRIRFHERGKEHYCFPTDAILCRDRR